MNNQQGGLGDRHNVLSKAIFPLYSCINHSCDPNAIVWGYLKKPSPAYWKESSMCESITLSQIGGIVVAVGSSNDNPGFNSSMGKLAAAIFKASAKKEARKNASAKKDSKSEVSDTRSATERLLDELTNAHPSAEKLTLGFDASNDDSDGSDNPDDNKYRECAEISIIAKKDINAGEEIYISYVSGLSSQAGPNQRRFMLKQNWLPGDCMCTKCRKEDPASASTAATPADHVAENLANLNISTPDSLPALTKNQRKNKKKRDKERLAKQVAREQQEEGGPSKDYRDQEETTFVSATEQTQKDGQGFK
jgi:hypothetical protein